ncbi:LysR family transcriptional regulator [Microbacterium elymi]|uniref:LysR family transcriptional regulator n=1 Tax=Microbacterium elymi TaxID=2909587 RepID=A0ABY5NHX2_9MICO|nr:LysR family transcriptional regulator [Microbacterium elymi]UUT34790.1 LysR family transcriptional regulator [Microbacterium elymi]
MSGPSIRNPAEQSLASLDLNLLVSLHALIEEVSVTRAARRVGVSQPAMSHALRRVRDLFGDEIIVRRGNVSELTSRAQSLIAPLRDILLKTEQLVRGVTFDPATDGRTVTVALTSSSIRVLGNRLLQTVHAQAPNMHLRFRIARADIDEMFTTDGVDVALMPRAVPTRHPRELLYEDGWVVIAGRDDVTEQNVVEVLRTRPHVLFDTGAASYVYDIMQAHGIHVDVAATVTDSMMLADLVAGGPFVAVHLAQVVRALPASSELWSVPLPFPTGATGMDMVWSPWVSDDAFTQWFRGVLRSCAP